jgi:hypothetical protein
MASQLTDDKGKRVNRRLKACIFGNLVVLGIILKLIILFES